MPDYGSPDFSTLGNLGQIYNQARRQAAEEQQFGPLGAQGALTLAHLANNARDFRFREQEAARAQGNTDRTFALQKQQADEAARGFDYREVEKNGEKQLIRINKATGQTELVPISGVPDAPTNPFAFGKQNEAQSKDSGYADRMFRAEGVLRDPAVEGAATDLKQNILGKAPGFAANYITSPEFQKFDQAKRDFVNAVLRRESGAAISQSEFDNANKQYFPQPGESAEKIAEKRRNRQDAIAGVAGGGGPSYKPPFTFGANGELVPSGAPPRGQAKPNAAQAGQPPIPGAKQGRKSDGSPGWFIQSNGKTYLVE